MAYVANNNVSGIQDVHPCMQTDQTQYLRKDCFFFVHLGSCWYGPYCRFNHPPGHQDENADPVDQEGSNGNVSPTRKIPCKYFNSGYCKYGIWCEYDHSTQAFVRDPALHYNSLGFPLRPGKRDCSYYMRTYGHCAYGAWCKFNHPEFDYGYGGDDDQLDDDDDELDEHESFGNSSYVSSSSSSGGDQAALEYENGSTFGLHTSSTGGFSMRSEGNSSLQLSDDQPNIYI